LAIAAANRCLLQLLFNHRDRDHPGLFPLASHGGPFWKPACYTQIGGLAVATFITLLLVPVFYSLAVLDSRIVKWKTAGARRRTGGN